MFRDAPRADEHDLDERIFHNVARPAACGLTAVKS